MHFVWLALTLVFELNLSGTVRDSSGGVLAGAEVVAFDESGCTEIARSITDESGRYRLTLPEGASLLRASAPLFQSVSTPLSAESSSVVDFTLAPAALSESVTVKSTRPVPLLRERVRYRDRRLPRSLRATADPPFLEPRFSLGRKDRRQGRRDVRRRLRESSRLADAGRDARESAASGQRVRGAGLGTILRLRPRGRRRHS